MNAPTTNKPRYYPEYLAAMSGDFLLLSSRCLLKDGRSEALNVQRLFLI